MSVNSFFAFIDRMGDRLANFIESNYQKNIISYQIIFYLLIGVALFVVLNTVILGDENNGLWLFVFKFQTLITGVFAIIAALITVRTMRITDEKQELRHRELMSLNLRRDRMIVARAAKPQLEEIIDIRKLIDNTINDFHNVDEVWVMMNRFGEFLKRKQIREVEEFLSPVGYRAIQNILETIEHNSALIDKYFQIQSYKSKNKAEKMFIISFAQQACANLRYISSNFLQLANAIQELVTEFKLQ